MSLKDQLVVGYGYSLIYKIKVDPLSTIASQLSAYNLWAVLMVLNKLSMLLTTSLTSQDPTAQVQVIRALFPVAVRKEIVKVVSQSRGERWILLTEHNINIVAKLAFENSPHEGGKDILSADDKETVGKWLLLATDAVTSTYTSDSDIIRPLNYKIEEVRIYLTRAFFTRPVSEQAINQICRYISIFEIAQDANPGFDIKRKFEESLGISIEDYLVLTFFLMAHWSVRGARKDINSGVAINKSQWFKNASVEKEALERFLKHISFEPKNYKNINKEIVEKVFGGHESYVHNFLLFMKKPLIRKSDDTYICPFPDFLNSKISSGLYWSVENYLLENGPKLEYKALPSIWGSALEKYVNDRFASIAKSDYYPNYTQSNVEWVDGLLRLSHTVVFIETKSTHFTEQAKLKGNRTSLQPTLNRLFGKSKKGARKGVAQLTHAIKSLEDGVWGLPFENLDYRLLPVLVVEEPIPIDSYNRKFYEDIARGQGCFYESSSVLPFLVLSGEEIEILEAIGHKSGLLEIEKLLVQYAQMIGQRNEIGYNTQMVPFGTFLYAQNYKIPANIFIQSKFDKLAKEAEARLAVVVE